MDGWPNRRNKTAVSNLYGVVRMLPAQLNEGGKYEMPSTCFVASFGRFFAFFTSRDQLVARKLKKCSGLIG